MGDSDVEFDHEEWKVGRVLASVQSVHLVLRPKDLSILLSVHALP